jgi:uncharacterized membrane protein
MLVSFPVAFWTGALGTDIAGFATGDPFWWRMSVTLIAMGTATGALASVFGYIDYATIRMNARARSVATIHLWTSLATLALYACALALRLHAFGSYAGTALSTAGTLVLLVGGYYGSELANRYRVGIAER